MLTIRPNPVSGFSENIPPLKIGIDHLQHMEAEGEMEIVPFAVFPVIGIIGAQAGLRVPGKKGT
jgi:hypothetical protein